MMKNPALFASDLHGNRYAYNNLFARAEADGIKTVILGGDLTPKWPILRFGAKGAVIPLHPKQLCIDQTLSRRTYVDYLERIEDQVRSTNRARGDFEKLGGYPVMVSGHISFEDLLQNQRVLRKVLEAFEGVEALSKLELDAIEWDVLEGNIMSHAEKINTPTNPMLLLALRLLSLPGSSKRPVAKFSRDIGMLIERHLQSDETTEEMRHVMQLIRTLTAPLFIGGLPNNKSAIHALIRATAESDDLYTWVERFNTVPEAAAKAQVRFIEVWLNRRIRSYKRAVPGAQVYAILGNDDHTSCVAPMRQLHERGVLHFLHDEHSVVELACGIPIAGYPYWHSADNRFYDGWNKTEAEMAEDLLELTDGCDAANTVFVIHQPPKATVLDVGHNAASYGSDAVRSWIGKTPALAMLFGHVHESPFVGGSWRADFEGTPGYNAGGWHDKDLCAILLDLDDPKRAEWIADRSKIKTQTP